MNLIYKALEIIVGDKVSIRRGFTSGFVAGVPVSLLIYTFTADPSELLVGLFLIFFAAMFVGQAIGWGFTRPIALVLAKMNPEWKAETNWGLSNAFVWVLIGALFTFPLNNPNNFAKWAPFLIVTVVSTAFGILGGRKAVRKPLKNRNKSRERTVAASFVNATLHGVTMTFIERSPLIGFSQVMLRAMVLVFAETVIFWLIAGLLIYSFIKLIGFLLLLISRFRENAVLIDVLLSAVGWFLIGLFIKMYPVFGVFGPLTGEFELSGVVLTAVLTGFYGACGGFAMSRFRDDYFLEGNENRFSNGRKIYESKSKLDAGASKY